MLSVDDFALENSQINIPIDYYRILGVPVTATLEQIEQAYHDRSVQLPRSEYTHKAITARQQLIRKSYQILSDPRQRQNYDNYCLSCANPEITIEGTQLLGALVILEEFGEYELVLKLSKNQPESQDLFLTLALANLELGREKWQQGKYEKAASFLQSGQKILVDKQICLKIQQEITHDIYKLRPYRILELLSLNLNKNPERQTGLNLLQQMLDQRQGIEGKGNDYSGLNLDDFLRFIQQIQSYLTVEEQQNIFEPEAKRPSPVATYLAFYALLARGFAQKNPELIVKGKKLLKRLTKHQDIYLEQGVCNLLLGQTDAALQSLDKSQESQTLNFIKQQSQDAPDLLPGLCLYTERWLQSEVFPHFRDLTNSSVSLEEYFNDLDVQNYLNNLPVEQELATVEAEKITEINSVSEQLFNASSFQTLQPLVIESRNTTDLAMGEVEAVRESTSNNKNSTDKIHQLPGVDGYFWKILIAGILGMGFLLVISSVWKKLSVPDPQLSLSVNESIVVIPKPPEIAVSPPVIVSPELLNKESAQIVINKWLDAKSRAFGVNHEVEALAEILVDPLLTKRIEIANLVKSENSYREYDHNLEIESVTIDENNPSEAAVIAQVKEAGKYYQNGRFLTEKSYNSDLRIRYDLVLVGDQWFINNIVDIGS